MIKNGLYHYLIGFPEGIKIKSIFGLTPTIHATQRAQELFVEIPLNFHSWRSKIIEIEFFDNKPIKFVARQPYSETFDLCMAVLIEEKKIKTIWLNKNDDGHKTLDKSKYLTP